MSRRAFITGLGAVLAAPLAAEAQQLGKVPRIGVIPGLDRSGGARYTEAFTQGLGDLGYVEGQSIAFEYRWSEGRHRGDVDKFAADLVRVNVDVIVVGTGRAALAAKKATGTIPIVIAVAPDPVREGLVATLARPGGNITGLSYVSADLAPKQLELLKMAAPQVSRVAVLWNRAIPAHALLLREMEVAARTLAVTLQAVEIGDAEKLDDAFAEVKRERANGLLVLPNTMWTMHGARLLDLTARHRLPAMYSSVSVAAAGGLMAYAVDARDNWRRAAAYVDKILKGAKPGDLPVEQPTKFELVINLKTAKVLGLAIPPSLLLRADQVIE